LAGHIVLLSGRAGYELLQNCAAAQATIVAAIGAPSTMAVELARRHHITLVGFLRRERCNVYTHPHRIVANPAGAPR
jgi:FdhD protein